MLARRSEQSCHIPLLDDDGRDGGFVGDPNRADLPDAGQRVHIAVVLVDLGSNYTAGIGSEFTTAHGDRVDMTFRATFDSPVTATPEPASMTLMATGLVGMVGFARRRRKSTIPG
jgi:hypothetical protein